MNDATMKAVIMCESGVTNGSTLCTYVEGIMHEEGLDYAALILRDAVAVDSATKEETVNLDGAYLAGFKRNGLALKLMRVSKIDDAGQRTAINFGNVRRVERIILDCVREGKPLRNVVVPSWILRCDPVTISALNDALVVTA